jgi:signal transduction histidine kinase/ligand-binding sensor domain-containing protein
MARQQPFEKCAFRRTDGAFDCGEPGRRGYFAAVLRIIAMAPKRWICLAFVLALAITARSQPASGWRVYRVTDGLPESACVSVSLGLNGKILATHPNAGISELDGYSIQIFPWSGPPARGVSESPGGQLWALVPEGLKERREDNWLLHAVPEIAAEFRNNGSDRSVPFLPVQQGRVLFLLADRLMEFNVEESIRPRTVELRAATATRIGRFTGMSPARDGGLWIAGRQGLARVAGPLRSLKPEDTWQEFLPPESLGIENLREPRADDGGGVMLLANLANGGPQIGVYFTGENWIPHAAAPERIRFAWLGPDKIVRAATPDSLLIWRDGRFVESEEISARQYFDLAIEPGGAFWLATSDGLFRCAQPAWRTPPALASMNSHVRSIAIDSAGRLWLVANGRLHWLQNDMHEEFALPDNVRSSASGSLFPLKNGNLLVAFADGVFQFNPERRKFSPVPPAGSGAPWIPLGTLKDGGICVRSVNPAAKETTLEVYDGSRLQPLSLPPPPDLGAITVCFAAQNGDFWLGGDAVACFRGGKWQTFSSTDGTTPERVLSFTELTDGKIWCATPQKIWEFDGRQWSLVRAGFERLNLLLRGSDGSIWAASDGGAHRFREEAWIDQGLVEGLPGVSVQSIAEDQQGHIWAATSRGLSRYFPEADTDPPKTDIRRLGNEEQKLFEGDTLNLLFSGRDKWKFTPRDRLLFSYRMDQHDWSPFEGENNAAYFPDLPAGKHYFQVRAMDRNGNFEPPVQVEFAVGLPWYRETRLVLISFAGLATALFFAALSFNRHRKLLRSYAEVELKVGERTRELEVANRELLHSQKMNALGTLAAGIAHDFNNILSIVKGSAQIIEENTNNPEKIRTRVDRIKTVVEQGSGIVKAMLGFSRDSDGQPGECDPNGVVDDTCKLLGDRFLREVELKIEREENLPAVSASKDFIQQILLNFIFNAAESMDHRKQLILSTHALNRLPAGMVLLPAASAGYVAISVRDFGCGIPAENLPRIFEPFFTTKSLSARRGTGLGLSMVYELAKKMEAGLAVESVVDKGSVFTLILPVKEKGN